MSVWDSLVGQKPVIDMLSRIAQGDPSQITQSWLICGPPGSGRSNMARAFAAALESPDHGMSAEPTRVTQQVLAGTHPDVTVLTTNKVTIGIDQVREIHHYLRADARHRAVAHHHHRRRGSHA